MIRYGVRFQSIKDLRDVEICWVSIGKGTSIDIQDVYLYTNKELAQAKVDYYNSKPQWWRNAEMVEFEVKIKV
jgi:hypothetical protein